MVGLCVSLSILFYDSILYTTSAAFERGWRVGWVGGGGVVWTILTGRDNRIMDRGPCASSFVMGQFSFSGITLFSCCFSSQGD